MYTPHNLEKAREIIISNQEINKLPRPFVALGELLPVWIRESPKISKLGNLPNASLNILPLCFKEQSFFFLL